MLALLLLLLQKQKKMYRGFIFFCVLILTLLLLLNCLHKKRERQQRKRQEFLFTRLAFFVYCILINYLWVRFVVHVCVKTEKRIVWLTKQSKHSYMHTYYHMRGGVWLWTSFGTKSEFLVVVFLLVYFVSLS